MIGSLIRSDYIRCGINKIHIGVLLRIFFIFTHPGLKFLTIFRLTQYYRKRRKIVFYFFLFWLQHLKYKYGFDISYRTKIGEGFYIGHFGGVVIHGDVIIGSNCNISQGVTIGISNSPKNKGCPIIGNNVFIGPGACIFGHIKIGNNVVIGANAVVSQNIPEGSTVINNNISIINKDLSSYYIQNCV